MNERQVLKLEIVEKATAGKVRRRATTKRKTVPELSPIERAGIREGFLLRGAGSDVRLAEEFGAQRLEVMSIVVDGQGKEIQRLKRGLDTVLAQLFMRGARSADRKLPEREKRLRSVTQEGVA